MSTHDDIRKLAMARLGTKIVRPPVICEDIRKQTTGFPVITRQIRTFGRRGE